MFFLQKHLVFDNLEVAMSKILAKYAKTQSFLGCKEFKNPFFYRLHILNDFASLRSLREINVFLL